MSLLRIAVFASGNGSNFQAIIDTIKGKKLDAQVELLVCDKPGANVVKRAESAGIAVFAFRPKEYKSREQYEAIILEKLNLLKIDLIVLAGYMRLITDTLVKPFHGKMINVHPSLLPAFPGIHAIKQALDYGVKVTGVTVHFVDGGMDTGSIIAQQTIAIKEEDTVDSLSERVHAIEHQMYPQVIQWIGEGRVTLKDRKTIIKTI